MNNYPDLFNLLDKLTTPIFVLRVKNHDTRDFDIVFANEANVTASGVNLKEFVGKDFRTSFPGIYDVGLHEFYYQSIETNTVVEVGEIEYGDDKVNKSTYVVKATPLNEIEVMITYIDVSSLKKAEQMLIQKNIVLTEKNRSLEEYAYITSHDLQEPLRTISSFVNVLLNDYRDQIDENGKRVLDYIASSANRMKGMIHGVLQHSRLGIEKDKVQINCNKIIEEIEEDLHKIFKDKSVTIEVGKLPLILGNSNEMRILFQNLIGNAIKYQNAENKPVINICINETENKNWLFSVKDNGLGIAKNNQKKIFKMFQRLHLQGEYEGTGIGLANCQKIVKSLDGDIWVESEEGKGSTFYFTIPQE